MKGLRIIRMADAERDVRDEVAGVFVDGYYNELSYFTRDRSILKSAFKRLFSPEALYLAEESGVIVGMAGCSSNKLRAMPVELQPLQEAFGINTGELAFNVMSGEFNSPLPYDDDTGYIECVATLERARGRGVSTSLMIYVMEELPYRRYVLEVTDRNETAIRLYRKLGFQEIERRAEDHAEERDFNERIYMEWRKTGDLKGIELEAGQM
ncbi:GNAT family N-acetyltransferase [Paenibacillus cisolokensis]|uniref:GNAT family N-acetyltransferase n=1 Tax=Paenibacillus cisolokensis TaxID=1658519 RepID=UPI003D2D42BA